MRLRVPPSSRAGLAGRAGCAGRAGRRLRPGGIAMRLRLFVGFLVVLVTVGAAMPAYARLLGGPHAHACSCAVSRSGHAECACPLCFPELNDVDTFGAPSLTGRCGTDDPGWRTLSTPAVPTSGIAILAPLAHVQLALAPPVSPSQWITPPDLPPPRA